MTWRWLLALLVVLNIGVAGWLALHQHDRVLPPLADPGVPMLELLPAPGHAAMPTPAAPVSIPTRPGPDDATGQ